MASLPLKLFEYRVISKIGTGAASEVFVVQDTKTKKVWALKHVVRVDQKSDRFIEQVEQEYAIGIKLKHKCIRGMHELKRKKKLFKTIEVGLLMELVDAGTLETFEFESIAEATKLFVQIARGLEHMNNKGFVHADMKPINVMVTDKKQVKIIDLGQACAVNHIKQRIQGTPGYIAPEQANRQAITAQTDVYNFGAMMYWVLARRVIPTVLPPEGEGLSSVPLGANMLKMPQPLHTINQQIPAALSNLVQECVQFNPGDRVQGMGLVADRLESIAKSFGDSQMDFEAVVA